MKLCYPTILYEVMNNKRKHMIKTEAIVQNRGVWLNPRTVSLSIWQGNNRYLKAVRKKQIDSLKQCRKVTIQPSMGRMESKAIVISLGNIAHFHIFFLPTECYAQFGTRHDSACCFKALVSDSVYRHVKYQLSKI